MTMSLMFNKTIYSRYMEIPPAAAGAHRRSGGTSAAAAAWCAPRAGSLGDVTPPMSTSTIGLPDYYRQITIYYDSGDYMI